MYCCLNILLTCVRKGKQRENVREFMVSDHRWLTLHASNLQIHVYYVGVHIKNMSSCTVCTSAESQELFW